MNAKVLIEEFLQYSTYSKKKLLQNLVKLLKNLQKKIKFRFIYLIWNI